MKNAVSKKELEKFIAYIKQGKHTSIPTFKQLFTFQVQRVLSLTIHDIDKKYWTSRGWDKQIFYYKCKINLFKRIIFKLFFRMLYKKIKKQSELNSSK